jgi:hypothetical protein
MIMTKIVSALYDTYDAAHSAVSALEAYGVPNSDISLVANNVDNWHRESTAAEGAGTGAGVGAAIGGVGGLLTGLGIMAIPGVGPVVAAGWLVATAVGAVVGGAAGAATGGIIGSLTEAGVPETDAHLYAEGVRRGGALVTARVADAQASDANAILQRYQAVDLNARGRLYRDEGWSRFDPAAPAYTSDQVARERARYIVR